jgi:glutamyl-tRNA synthetase
MFRTRFAPSPTGFLHLGSMRTALFAWLLAKHYGGTCALRIEDTDKNRSNEAYTKLIFEGLNWFGLSFDGPVIYQSQRASRYQEIVDLLLSRGQAYYCSCSQERLSALREAQQQNEATYWHYDRHCRGQTQRPEGQSVVRLAVPQSGVIQAFDHIQGMIEQPWEAMDDWIIQRSDGSCVYNFAVVVDDFDQEITHVIRGADHVSNTPKQAALYHLLGWPLPDFCHIPLVLDQQGAKLSKRHKSANMLQYRDAGFLPEALINAIARLGWSHNDQEIFTLDELIKHFSFESLGHSPAMFNDEKFHWIARQHFARLSPEQFAARGAPFFPQATEQQLVNYAVLITSRAESFLDARQQLLFLTQSPEINFQDLIQQYPAITVNLLLEFVATIEQLESADLFFETLKSFTQSQKIAIKDLALPIRVILTGTTQSPDLKNVVSVLGLQEVCQRLRAVTM